MLPEEDAQATLADVDSWWNVDEELVEGDVLDALLAFRVAVTVTAEDVDDLQDAYRDIVEGAAACTRGAVTVSDVELCAEDSHGRLGFLRNGEPASWRVDEAAGFYLDMLSVFEHFNQLDPKDDRGFHRIPGGEPGVCDYWVLATPAQAEVPRTEWGLTLEDLPGAGRTG